MNSRTPSSGPRPYFEFLDQEIDYVLPGELWETIRAGLSAEDSIVDLGCGVGTLLWNISQLAYSTRLLVGLTREWPQCTVVKAVIPDCGIVCGEATRTPFKDGRFSVVFTTMVLEHTEPAAMLQEIRRILSPSGRLVISTVLRGQNALYYYKDPQGRPLLCADHKKEFDSKEEFEELLTAHGFDTISNWVRPVVYSPLDAILRRLYRVTASAIIKETANNVRMKRLRRASRMRVPGYYEIGAIATAM